MIVHICKACKNTDVICNADVVWDIKKQEWVLGDIHDNPVCVTCGSIDIEEVET